LKFFLEFLNSGIFLLRKCKAVRLKKISKKSEKIRLTLPAHFKFFRHAFAILSNAAAQFLLAAPEFHFFLFY